jgi:hypothetical protein
MKFLLSLDSLVYLDDTLRRTFHPKNWHPCHERPPSIVPCCQVGWSDLCTVGSGDTFPGVPQSEHAPLPSAQCLDLT